MVAGLHLLMTSSFRAISQEIGIRAEVEVKYLSIVLSNLGQGLTRYTALGTSETNKYSSLTRAPRKVS